MSAFCAVTCFLVRAANSLALLAASASAARCCAVLAAVPAGDLERLVDGLPSSMPTSDPLAPVSPPNVVRKSRPL